MPIESRSSNLVSPCTGASMAHGWRMNSDVCSASVAHEITPTWSGSRMPGYSDCSRLGHAQSLDRLHKLGAKFSPDKWEKSSRAVISRRSAHRSSLQVDRASAMGFFSCQNLAHPFFQRNRRCRALPNRWVRVHGNCIKGFERGMDCVKAKRAVDLELFLAE